MKNIAILLLIIFSSYLSKKKSLMKNIKKYGWKFGVIKRWICWNGSFWEGVFEIETYGIYKM